MQTVFGEQAHHLEEIRLIEAKFSVFGIILSVILGGFVQIILFIALCIFEFHHRHRNDVLGDFAFEQPQPNVPIPDDEPQIEEEEPVENIENDIDNNDEEQNVLPPEQEQAFLNVWCLHFISFPPKTNALFMYCSQIISATHSRWNYWV